MATHIPERIRECGGPGRSVIVIVAAMTEPNGDDSMDVP